MQTCELCESNGDADVPATTTDLELISGGDTLTRGGNTRSYCDECARRVRSYPIGGAAYLGFDDTEGMPAAEYRPRKEALMALRRKHGRALLAHVLDRPELLTAQRSEPAPAAEPSSPRPAKQKTVPVKPLTWKRSTMRVAGPEYVFYYAVCPYGRAFSIAVDGHEGPGYHLRCKRSISTAGTGYDLGTHDTLEAAQFSAACHSAMVPRDFAKPWD